MGHVNNTIYFRYFEQARCEWIHDMSLLGDKHPNVAPVIINASCDFLQALTAPGIAVVQMHFGQMGRSSLETFYTLTKEDSATHQEVTGADDTPVVFARGAAKMVWLDINANKSTDIPSYIRHHFQGE